MLELTGKCCNGIKAVEFVEKLEEIIPEEYKTPEFLEKYEASLNRMRYEIGKGIGKKKKVTKAVKSWYKDFLSCGECGFSANEPSWKFCPNYGTLYMN